MEGTAVHVGGTCRRAGDDAHGAYCAVDISSCSAPPTGTLAYTDQPFDFCSDDDNNNNNNNNNNDDDDDHHNNNNNNDNNNSSNSSHLRPQLQL